MKAYMDNGATTMVAAEVEAVMRKYFLKDYGNASSLHSFGQMAHEVIEKSRAVIAKKINALPEEIIFTGSGTESNNMALRGACLAIKEKSGKNHIITSKIEHPAVLHTCETLEKNGFKVTYLDVDNEGKINLQKLSMAISQNTILVSIMHANNEIGVIQDIEKIGKICREKGVLFHTDAVQSFAKIPIDVKQLHIDLMSISAHKIHGPKGVAALFIRKGTDITPIITGGGQEFGFRSGTENIPGIAGFAKAANLTTKEDIERMQRLRDRIIKSVMSIPDTRLNGPLNNRLCNNANFSFKYVEGESLILSLDAKGIAASTGSACSSKSLTPSHVLIAIGLRPEIAHGSLRISISRYTKDKEIDYFLKVLPKVVKKLRQMSALSNRTEKNRT